jgi:hypothetical protein
MFTALLFHHEATVAHMIKLVSGPKPDRHLAAFQQLYKWRELALPQELEAVASWLITNKIFKIATALAIIIISFSYIMI